MSIDTVITKKELPVKTIIYLLSFNKYVLKLENNYGSHDIPCVHSLLWIS